MIVFLNSNHQNLVPEGAHSTWLSFIYEGGGHSTWFIGGGTQPESRLSDPLFYKKGPTKPEFRFIGGRAHSTWFIGGGAHSTRVWKSLTPPTNFKKTGYNQKGSKFRTVARQFFVFFLWFFAPLVCFFAIFINYFLFFTL